MGTADGGAAHGRLRPSLAGALGLTLASAVIWGIAHVYMGRRAVGCLLLLAYGALCATGAGLADHYKGDLATLAVQNDWLTGFTIAALTLACVWIAVVVRSYQITRPAGLSPLPRIAALTAVTVLCAAVCAPLVYAARVSDTTRSTLKAIFPTGGDAPQINADDPFNGRSRLNLLLLASDNAHDRTGTRTDSITVASIDTHTGDTVLIGIPRNLEHVPMPPGPPRRAFPYGFTGDGPETPDLINEVYQYAEDHPELEPGIPAGKRGPRLVTDTVEEVIGQPIDYYVIVDMFGFADIVDAMGGVRMKVVEPIPYGQNGGVLQPGDRVLNGHQALWYGRSRNDTDDYVRMGRQKCLLRAVAQQADPAKVLTKFDQLAAATKRAISTNIPQDLLPALIKLSDKAKHGAKISNLSFVPPLIYTGNPDFSLIRRLSAQAIGQEPAPSATPSDSPSDTASTPSSPSGSQAAASPAPTDSSLRYNGPYAGIDTSGSTAQGKPKPVSLDETCPS